MFSPIPLGDTIRFTECKLLPSLYARSTRLYRSPVLPESKLSTGKDLPNNVSTVRGSAAFPRAFMTYLVAMGRDE